MLSKKSQFRNLAAVVANPRAHHSTTVKAGAWIAAKDMQGHPLSLERMERVEAIPDPIEAAEVRTTLRLRRIRNKVRDRAILIGQTRPAPLILIDALPGHVGLE